jgi:N-acetylglucosaminyldiphosphoundecaprenol N-acetyl-beta-D-mannosaminyltransferase
MAMTMGDDAGQSTAWPPRVEVLGMPLNIVGFQETLDLLVRLARGDHLAYVVTANVDHVVRLNRRPELRPLYADADLVVADGMPLVWASRILGHRLPGRVAGSDLFPCLCQRAATEGLTVYLLGGDPGTADAAAAVLKQRNPALQIVGIDCPPYGFESDAAECERIVSRVESASPAILFVALGSPKQEQWIYANRSRCGARLSIGVGISFSFVSGQVKRAPKWMQRVGLEWFHRMAQEPGRLCRRYLVEDLAFSWILLRDLIRLRTRRTVRPCHRRNGPGCEHAQD